MKRMFVLFTTLAALSMILPSPAYAASSCDELRVVSGNNTFAPSTVSFHARASDTSGAISGYRFYFGDGTQTDSVSPDVKHAYNSSGTFTTRVDAKTASGVFTSSNACQAIFSLLTSPFESQKSACSNVFILDGSTVPAGMDVKFFVTGYDNKSGIKGYKIDFGNGQIKNDNVGSFDLTFDTPGTYTIKGYIQDSKNNWKGGTDFCQIPLYVTGQPIQVQPDTGTPTLFTLSALVSGLVLFLIVFSVRGGVSFQAARHGLGTRKTINRKRSGP